MMQEVTKAVAKADISSDNSREASVVDEVRPYFCLSHLGSIFLLPSVDLPTLAKNFL